PEQPRPAGASEVLLALQRQDQPPRDPLIPAMVNADYLGREFHGTPPYVVSAAKIAEFAAAVAAASPIHFDPAAARALGYADVVAPPTFAVVIAQRAEAEYIEDPDA